MNYTVESAMRTGEYTTQYGPMAKYAIKFQNQDEAVEMSQKPDTPAPKAGDILEGEIESTQHGKRFKKARVGGGRFNDPQTRMEIIRQNALTNAVNFCVANLEKVTDNHNE